MVKKRHQTGEDVVSHLPLNPKVLMVLMALLQGPTHGYEIKKRAESQSGGSVRLDAGSLYRTLAQLEDRGLVQETDDRPDPEDDDPRRRYYELTALGARVLKAEARRLREMLDLAEGNQFIPEPGSLVG